MSEFNPETAKAIALAISDPGATTPRMPGENVTSWSTRAVHRIVVRLIAEAEQRGAERVAARVEALAVEWDEQGRESDRYIDRAHHTEIHEVMAEARWFPERAAELRAALKDGTP